MPLPSLTPTLWPMATPICAIFFQGEISFSKNGKELGVAFKLPPSAKGPFFPAVVLKSAQVHNSAGVCQEAWTKPLIDHVPRVEEYALLCGSRCSQ